MGKIYFCDRRCCIRIGEGYYSSVSGTPFEGTGI